MKTIMKLVGHGGYCCGINHIYAMGWHPDAVCYDVKWNDTKLTNVQRLDELIEEVWKNSSVGVIEIVLCDERDYAKFHDGKTKEYSQVHAWRPALRKRGFKQVSRAYNPNSENNIFIFHKYLGERPFMPEDCIID